MLISNPQSEHKEIVSLLKRRIEGYITAIRFVLIMYNVHDSLLDEAIKITPGKRSPTITSLDETGLKSVASLVAKKEVSNKMDELHELGATDILVVNINNSRM